MLCPLPPDCWVEILRFLDNPKDYRNGALICSGSGEASLILKNQKAIEFSKKITHGNVNQNQTSYCVLPNQTIHGPYIKINWMDDYCIVSTLNFEFGVRKKGENDDTQKKFPKSEWMSWDYIKGIL